MTVAGIYTRLSSDPDGTSTATARQQADCRQLAELRGFVVADVYEDNDISAYKKKVVRPAFERMLVDLKAGHIDVVIVWKSDRLARQPRDLERFIDAAEDRNGQLVSVTEPEFSGSSGLLILRMFVAFANHESGVKSERVVRKLRQSAESGKPHTGGMRPFGYTRQHEHDPVEAPLVRELVARIIGGESVRTVSADWNARGIVTAQGARWVASNMRRLLRSPGLAGLRTYHGTLIAGTWEGIVTREQWEQVRAIAEGRTKEKRTVRRHMLSGLATCGRCGGSLTGTRVLRTSRGEDTAEYRCPAETGCGALTIRTHKLEEVVAERFFHVVSTPAFTRLVASAIAGQTHTLGLVSSLREDEASLEQLAKDHYVEHAISRPEFQAARMGLEARVEETKRRLAREASPLLTLPTEPNALRAEWERRGPVWQRALLELVVKKITVLPVAGNQYLDRVKVTWRV